MSSLNKVIENAENVLKERQEVDLEMEEKHKQQLEQAERMPALSEILVAFRNSLLLEIRCF